MYVFECPCAFLLGMFPGVEFWFLGYKYMVSRRRFCRVVFRSSCTNICSLWPRAAAVTLSILVCVRLAFLYILGQLWWLCSSSSNLSFCFAFCCPCLLANCTALLWRTPQVFCLCVCARACTHACRYMLAHVEATGPPWMLFFMWWLPCFSRQPLLQAWNFSLCLLCSGMLFLSFSMNLTQ